VTNAYDALDNRVGQTQGTNVTTFVINPNTGLPQVLMRIKNGVTDYYIYGPGLLYQITETVAATNTLTYHYDYRGSTVALTDDSGNVADRFEYSLYATMTYRSGTDDVPFLFNGRYGVQTDGNGLLYMRARYYNPYLCRFINPDPIGFSGGMNFYAYADGNPVSLMDPFGLDAGYWTGVGQVFKGYGRFFASSWHAISPWGDADKTLDALFDVPFHPIATAEAIGHGIKNTFEGLINGNLETQGEAVAEILATIAPALKAAEVGELGNLLRVVDDTDVLPTLTSNAKGELGKDWSRQAILDRGDTIVGEEVDLTVNVNGVDVPIRADFLTQPAGADYYVYVESKYSPKASYTPGQQQVIPQIVQAGDEGVTATVGARSGRLATGQQISVQFQGDVWNSGSTLYGH